MAARDQEITQPPGGKKLHIHLDRRNRPPFVRVAGTIAHGVIRERGDKPAVHPTVMVAMAFIGRDCVKLMRALGFRPHRPDVKDETLMS
jgi:hypothetical protein